MSFATKRIGPCCCTLFTFIACYPLQIILSQNYLLSTISVLAENTLLKTACHFLLLLVGFDTLTYRKDYDRSPILVVHQDSFLAPLPVSEAPLVRKDLYSVLKFTVTCYLLPVMNYLITKLSVTDNSSACREYLAENRLLFLSAPRWVRHSYLSKGLR